MTPSLRRDACPSLAAPMQTGDGLLVRINTVTGAISPRHLALVAEAAAHHGNGILEVTRRGNLQVRGLTAESAEKFSQQVLDSGIEVRSGVPVETGPLAGLDPTEIIDSRKIVSQLGEKIGETDLTKALGPKVSVVVDGGGRISMRDVLADVRLTAVENDGDVRWQVAIGGTADTARALGIADGEIAVEVAVDLLQAIAVRGRSGRGRDLTEQAFSMAWKGCLTGTDGESVVSNDPLSASLRSAPLPHIRGGEEGRQRTIGPFLLKQGRAALGLGLPFGQATAHQLSALAEAAENEGISEFRLAPGHALLAICDTTEVAERFAGTATRLGFITDAADPRLRIVACAGAPACSSGLIHTKEIAAELAAAGALPENDVVHVSGCAKRCAEPASPAFTILGTPDGAGILEGKTGRELTRVAEREVPAAFQRVLESRDMGRDIKSAPRVRHRTSA